MEREQLPHVESTLSITSVESGSYLIPEATTADTVEITKEEKFEEEVEKLAREVEEAKQKEEYANTDSIQQDLEIHTSAPEDSATTPTHKPRRNYNMFIPGYGIFLDLKRRIPWYFSDIKDGIHPKMLTAAIYMFFASIAPALSFGAYLTTKTNGELGITEVLFATALCGTIFSVFGGQGLIIVGVTGPVSIYCATVYNLAVQFKIPYLPWLAVAGLWSALLHIMLAVANVTVATKLVTRFTTEIFGALIGVIYLYTAGEDIVLTFMNHKVDAALLTLLVAIGVFYIATQLDNARGWVYFSKWVCKILADCAVPISIAVFTGLVYIPVVRQVPIEFLVIPSSFRPTPSRNWLVQFQQLPVGHIFSAIIPGIVLTALFFFDHNVSSLLSQKREFKLKKGSAFHWDFFVVGMMVGICSIIGIPYTNGLIPQAPLHVQALADIKEIEHPQTGERVQFYKGVRETRLSNLLQSLLIGVVMVWGQVVVKLIPKGVMIGLFLFMGASSFYGNQFFARIRMWIVHPSQRNKVINYSFIRKVRLPVIFAFTLIQFICWAINFGFTMSPLSLIFPILILILVPLRQWILTRLFTKENLQLLDNDEVDGLSNEFMEILQHQEERRKEKRRKMVQKFKRIFRKKQQAHEPEGTVEIEMEPSQ